MLQPEPAIHTTLFRSLRRTCVCNPGLAACRTELSAACLADRNLALLRLSRSWSLVCDNHERWPFDSAERVRGSDSISFARVTANSSEKTRWGTSLRSLGCSHCDARKGCIWAKLWNIRCPLRSCARCQTQWLNFHPVYGIPCLHT